MRVANLSRSSQVFLTRAIGHAEPSSDCMVKEWVRRGDASPVEDVVLASIRSSYTPRKTKVNEHHAGMLAQSPLPLPPIVIHRASMRVITVCIGSGRSNCAAKRRSRQDFSTVTMLRPSPWRYT
jgi:hypothetical protein